MDDIISRQAVIDKIFESRKNFNNEFDQGFFVDKIRDLPPVNPQRTGHWILTSDDDYEYCTCSECGYQNGENWMIGSQIKFCQECGAKMPQESEDKCINCANNGMIDDECAYCTNYNLFRAESEGEK